MELTQTRLKELLHYDPLTGDFTWLACSSSRVQPGDRAGCLNSSGYGIIQIAGVVHRAHRLAFLYMEGRFPEKGTDHINHIRDDNRWCNLREVTQSENNKNMSKGSNNKSGVTGVSWHKAAGKWLASIMAHGEQQHIGVFIKKEDAVIARKYAELKYLYHPNHGNQPPKEASA